MKLFDEIRRCCISDDPSSESFTVTVDGLTFDLRGEHADALEQRAERMVREALEGVRDWCAAERCDDSVKMGGCKDTDKHNRGYCQAMTYTEGVCKDKIKELEGVDDAN